MRKDQTNIEENPVKEWRNANQPALCFRAERSGISGVDDTTRLAYIPFDRAIQSSNGDTESSTVETPTVVESTVAGSIFFAPGQT